jgi:hypothetical protein
LCLLAVYFLKPEWIQQFTEPQVVRGELEERLNLGKIEDKLKITLASVEVTKVYSQSYVSENWNLSCNGTAFHTITHTGHCEVTFDFSEGFEYSADSTQGVIYLSKKPKLEITPITTHEDLLTGAECISRKIPPERLVEDLNTAEKKFLVEVQSPDNMAEVEQRARSQLEFFIKSLNNKNIRFVFKDEARPSLSN